MHTLSDDKEKFNGQLINALSHSEDFEAITSMLDRVDPKALVDSHGKTLLHYAAAAKNFEVVRYLLDRGCDVDAEDEVATTPLILAVEATHLPTIATLLEANANIFVWDLRQRNPLRMAFSFVGYKNSKVATMFLEELKRRYSGDRATIARVLLEAGCSLPRAILLRDPMATRCMLSYGCSIDHRDIDGYTALHLAVKYEDLANVKLLVKLGADVNVEAAAHSQRPLHLYNFDSTSKAKLVILRFLLEQGASATATDSDGSAAASHIFRHGRVEDVEVLLQHGVDLFASDAGGSTFLQHAARNKNSGVIQRFQDRKFDVNAQDDSGDTALRYAAEAANWKALKFLLRSGADLTIENNLGIPVLAKCFWLWTEMKDKVEDCRKCVESLLQDTMGRRFVYENMANILEI